MAIPQARPTEYKGIVYRSKSEAMFARWLELSQDAWVDFYAQSRDRNVMAPAALFGFIYEPSGFDVDGWTPDFLTWVTLCPRSIQIPLNFIEIIEYKPTKPTETYADEFARRCLELTRRLDKWTIGRSSTSRFLLYWGSPFNDECGVVEAEIEGNKASLNWDYAKGAPWLTLAHREAILKTRFDLEAQ